MDSNKAAMITLSVIMICITTLIITAMVIFGN